jgi:hypothetical protein
MAIGRLTIRDSTINTKLQQVTALKLRVNSAVRNQLHISYKPLTAWITA